jgi:diadenylate cyclase
MTLYERLAALQFGWRDALDILIVAFLIYNILMLIRGTRAMQMAIGLSVIASAYFIARAFDLLALEALSQQILFYLPFAIIVLFQHEIRRALASFGKNPLIALFAPRTEDSHIDEIAEAAVNLAKHRVGALIAIERTQSLRAFAETGKKLDAMVSADLLVNIFTPNAPLHDGAAIIQGDRIFAAGVFLPLSSSAEIPALYGTRHRAALGLSEETDAMVLVISEENGSIGAALEGVLHENLSEQAVRIFLTDHVVPNGKEKG